MKGMFLVLGLRAFTKRAGFLENTLTLVSSYVHAAIVRNLITLRNKRKYPLIQSKHVKSYSYFRNEARKKCMCEYQYHGGALLRRRYF